MKKKAGLNDSMYVFFVVDCRTFDTSNIIDIHGLIEKIIGSLTGPVNGFNQTKCISLSNQKCMTQPTL